MKKILNFTIALWCSLNILATEKNVTVEIQNNWKQDKTDAPIAIKLNEISVGFPIKSAIIKDQNKEIPSQLDDLNGDRIADELAFVIDMPANSSKKVTITFSSEESDKQYESRVYADMLISDKKGKHVPITSLTITVTSNVYNQLHHHGPAFESELVIYRIYFDQKQTVDIYGKFNKGFELKESGFYPNDEQLAKGFGDDVLRVSGSCGVGTLKGWNGKKATHVEPVRYRAERIMAAGPIRTVVEVEDNDWLYQGSKLNMTTRYILYAGHRDAEVYISFEEPLKKEVFCTGVQDIKESVSFSDHKGLIACWGTDWPVNDTIKYAKETVGLATYIPQKYVKEEVKDKSNYLYAVGNEGHNSFNYNITFTSMKETFGYKSPEEWFAYVQEWKQELEHPCTVKIIK